MKHLPDSAFIMAALTSIAALLMKSEIDATIVAVCSIMWVIVGIHELFKK